MTTTTTTTTIDVCSSPKTGPPRLNLNDFIKNNYGSTLSGSSGVNGGDDENLSFISYGSATERTSTEGDDSNNEKKGWTLRRLALELSLWLNVFITFTKLVAYIQTGSLSVLAALLDSVLDVVSQLVLNYTEKHSSMQRSSALYPAGASRLEPIGVLTCASLMGMVRTIQYYNRIEYNTMRIEYLGLELNRIESNRRTH